MFAQIRIARLAIFVAKLESQTDHLRPLAATVCCGQRPQHFLNHREAIHGLWPPQFVVAEGHNFWKFTGLRKSDNPGANLPILLYKSNFKWTYSRCQYVERVLSMFPIHGKDSTHVTNTWKGSYQCSQCVEGTYQCSQYVERILSMFPIHGRILPMFPIRGNDPNNVSNTLKEPTHVTNTWKGSYPHSLECYQYLKIHGK